MAADLREGVVKVIYRTPAGVIERQGAGLIYSVADDYVYVVTSFHNVQDAPVKNGKRVGMSVLFFEQRRTPEQAVPAEVIPKTTDAEKDVTVLRIKRTDAPTSLEQMRLGTSITVKFDDTVKIIGHPVDSKQDWVVDPLAVTTEDATDVLHFSSRIITSGFSGGPLIDKDGLVIGLIRYDSVSQQSQTGEAIPIETVKDFVDRFPELRRDVQINAQLKQAIDLYFGFGRVVDHVRAKALFEKAAGSGDALSSGWLAFLEGTGSCGFAAKWVAASAAIDGLRSKLEALAAEGVGSASFLIGYADFFGWGGKQDVARARDAFQAAVKCRFDPARVPLAEFYFKGIGVDADASEALRILTEGNANPLPGTKVGTALIYLSGQGGGVSLPKARDLLGSAAEIGDPEAMLELGRLYLVGDTVAEAIGEAKKWFSKALEAGDPEGRTELARAALWEGDPGTAERLLNTSISNSGSSTAKLLMALLVGRGMVHGGVDATRAIHLLEEAAANGNIGAVRQLAVCYLEGVLVEQDTDKGLDLLRVALNRGSIGAIAVEGIRHYNGLGVPKDSKKAFVSFRRAASYNNPDGLVCLGLMYTMGQIPDKPADPERALEYFLRAGKKGSGPAYRLAGKLYAFGQGVPRDVERAEGFYRKALQFAEWGALEELVDLYVSDPGFATRASGISRVRHILELQEQNGVADAKALLGFLDLALNRNQAEAVRRIETSADKGSSIGADLLADIYVRGILRPQNLQKAERLLGAPVKKAYWPAVARLGYVCWALGREDEARNHWEKAAEQQHGYAKYCLAMMYLYGRGGLPTDQDKGMELLEELDKINLMGAGQLIKWIEQHGLPSPIPISSPGPR
jgi:TPR repeat protein